MTWYEDLFNRQTFLDLYAEQDSRLAVQEVDGLVSLLNLQPSQSILDVCCGYGRHAIELAKRGHRVTGVDLAPLQVNAAVAGAAKAGVQAEFLVGDARHMRFQQGFDVTLNLLTSFGLFEEDAEHLEMLARIADATKLGGLFLMDLWNREQVIRDFGEREIETRPDGIKIEEQWSFDPWRGRIDWDNTVRFPDGSCETWHQSVRAYTLVELKNMLGHAGFEMERVYGDFQGRAYSLDSPNMITVSRKLGG